MMYKVVKMAPGHKRGPDDEVLGSNLSLKEAYLLKITTLTAEVEKLEEEDNKLPYTIRDMFDRTVIEKEL